ncbi:hypothetical protein BKA62DRAFT_222224 [Auriculariales sp. MPI-PUGE-AT-0066]|nr:hypothetical protein BKA62DRAFT_222224 [Auriculariales sp. MPI-PUGE-AT-0066]
MLADLQRQELAFQAAHDKATTGCTGDSDPFCGSQFAHWPGPVLADPERGRIIIAYGKLCRGSEGSRCLSTELAGEMIGWGFFFVVPELGLGDRLKPSTGGAMDVTGSLDPALFGGAQDFFFSGGALAHNGFAYLYGSANILEGSKVARVPLASFEDKSQWVYWDGGAWQSDVNAGKGIMGPGAAGNTVFFSEPLNGFYNVYCPFGTNEVFMQSAPAPEGPWSDPVSLFSSTPVNNATNYACYAHPEFASADGLTQYISFFRTGDGAQVLTKVQLQ